MHVLHILPTEQGLDRPCCDGPWTIFFVLSNIVFPSFFLFVCPFELSLMLSRKRQLHTACYKRGVFLHFKNAVDATIVVIIRGLKNLLQENNRFLLNQCLAIMRSSKS